MKNLRVLVVVGLMITSMSVLSFADTTYTKYDYIQAVLEDNFELSQLKDDLYDETKEYRNALRSTQVIDELTWEEFDDNYDDSASKLNAMEVKLYNPLKEGKEYHDKYVETKKTEQAIRIEAERRYYNYLNAVKNLAIQNDHFDLAKDQYETKLLEQNLGQASALDVLGYEKSYNDAIVGQLKAVNAYEAARNDFNIYISQPVNGSIELQQQDIVLTMVELESIESSLEEMIANSYQKTALEAEIKRLEMDRQVKGRTSGFGNVKVELDQNQIALDEANEQLKDMPLTLEYQLRTKYNETKVAQNAFKSAEIQLEIAEANLRVAKVKEKNDMLSGLEYMQCKQDYDDALNTYFDAKLEAYSTIQGFNNFMALNTEAVPMDLK